MQSLATFIWSKAKSYILCSTAASIISGLTRASLIALVGSSLAHQHVSLLWYGVLCMVAPLSSVASEVANLRGVNETMFQLLVQLVRRILRLPLQQIEKIGSHRVLTILTQDLAVVTTGLQLIPNMILQASIIFGCLVYLAWLSIPSFAVVTIAIVLGAVSFRFVYVFAQRHVESARIAADAVFRQLEALTNGIKELKLHRARQESFLRDGIGQAATSYKKHSIIGGTSYSVVANWSQFLFFVLMGALLFEAPSMMPQTNVTLLTRFGLTLLFLLGPLTALSGSMTGLSGLMASYKRLEGISQSLFDGGIESDAGLRYFDNWRTIRLAAVAMEYDRGGGDLPFYLGPIDLEITRGEIFMISGGNGSGKTTLAKILCGLYVPRSGTIFVDEAPIGATNSVSFRELFSAVFADFYLFETLLGLTPAHLDRSLTHYLEMLQLQDKVGVEDGRYTTVALSYGQRKRLALLTACLEDRSVYVLDEWAADQDPNFKTVFYRSILPFLKRSGKTIIVISHDDAYYDVADRVIKLEDGRVVVDHLSHPSSEGSLVD